MLVNNSSHALKSALRTGDHMATNIGISVRQPKKTCKDGNCPFHGHIKVRGRQHTGTVVSTRMSKSAVVQWERRHFLPKYERYELRLSKITVHAPECLEIREGDIVRVAETRPLSKTKHNVIIENLGQEKGYKLRKQAMEESKVKAKEAKESKEAKDKDAEDGKKKSAAEEGQ